MRTSVRAVQSLGLLAGFYLLALGALGLVAVVDVLVLTHLDSWFSFAALGLIVPSGLVAVALIRGVFLVRHPEDEAPPGISVSEQQQPELWARVRALAAQAGTREPDEIRIIPVVDAAVSENPRLLGLIAGHRRMLVGVPLMLGLTEPQLDAVLAHELGHYSNRDTRLAGITIRGRQSLITVVEHAGASGRGITAVLFALYASLYMRVSESVSRRQELAADLAAARIAGRDHAADALRQVRALEVAYSYYAAHYAGTGWDAGLLPLHEEIYGGFRSLLSSAKRQQELDEIRNNLPAGETTPYDSHPPIRERVAALEALPADGRTVTGAERPAPALLRNPDLLFAAVAKAVLTPEAAAKRQASWDDLAVAGGRAKLVIACGIATEAVKDAREGDLDDLTALLDAVDEGLMDAIAAEVRETAAGAVPTRRDAREFARTAVLGAARRLAQLELLDAGRAHIVHSWDETVHLHFTDPALDAALNSALDAVVAKPPNTSPLRALLDVVPPSTETS
jgi:Zn-dependent protease with chaperone function